jgi:hypothetical protein
VSLPPPPPPPLYPQWPPVQPKQRRFVWWEALVGLVAPAIVGLLLYEVVGFTNAVTCLIVAAAATAIVAGIKRRFTLMVAVLVGLVLFAVALVAVALIALFTAVTAMG